MLILLLACTPLDTGTKPTDTGHADSDTSSETGSDTSFDTGSETGTDTGSETDTGTGPGTPAVLIPLYVYPSPGAWDAVANAAVLHMATARIYAIVNVNSSPYLGGPDEPSLEAEPSYTWQIPLLAAAGVTVLGYVPTGYGARASTDVIAMAEAWKEIYPDVSGIFFDEVAPGAADVPYYQTVATGLDFTVGNPGVTPDAAFAGVFDEIVVYESAGLPAVASLDSAIPASERAVLAYASTLDASWLSDARAATGMIYVTPDDLPNPWDTISPDLDALLAP